jgi:hypothetical protein
LVARDPDIEALDRPRGVAEADQQPARAQAIERNHQRILADAVIDHRDALAAGEFAHPGGHIFLGVEDDVLAAMGAGKLGLFFRPDSADDGGAQRIGPLAGDEADAAGRGMNEDGLAGRDLVGLAQQIAHRHALEHHRRGGLIGDPVGDLAHPVGGGVAGLTIGPDRTVAIGDAIADLELGDALAHRLDLARGFETHPGRELDGVKPAAVIGVDVVETDRGVADADFARAGRRQVGVDQLHDLRTAGLFDANGFHDPSVERCSGEFSD